MTLDWGDGCQGQTQSVPRGGYGAWTHQYANPGTYTLTLTGSITQPHWHQATVTRQLVVDPPAHITLVKPTGTVGGNQVVVEAEVWIPHCCNGAQVTAYVREETTLHPNPESPLSSGGWYDQDPVTHEWTVLRQYGPGPGDTVHWKTMWDTVHIPLGHNGSHRVRLHLDAYGHYGPNHTSTAEATGFCDVQNLVITNVSPPDYVRFDYDNPDLDEPVITVRVDDLGDATEPVDITVYIRGTAAPPPEPCRTLQATGVMPGQPVELVWDGKDGYGEYCEKGTYTYEISAVQAADNDEQTYRSTTLSPMVDHMETSWDAQGRLCFVFYYKLTDKEHVSASQCAVDLVAPNLDLVDTEPAGTQQDVLQIVEFLTTREDPGEWRGVLRAVDGNPGLYRDHCGHRMLAGNATVDSPYLARLWRLSTYEGAAPPSTVTFSLLNGTGNTVAPNNVTYSFPARSGSGVGLNNWAQAWTCGVGPIPESNACKSFHEGATGPLNRYKHRICEVIGMATKTDRTGDARFTQGDEAWSYDITNLKTNLGERPNYVDGLGYSGDHSENYQEGQANVQWRSYIMIHPEGGATGTEGCIGVVGEDPCRRVRRWLDINEPETQYIRTYAFTGTWANPEFEPGISFSGTYDLRQWVPLEVGIAGHPFAAVLIKEGREQF